jgi:hypothetical protein
MNVYSLGNTEMTLSRAEMKSDSQSRKREVDTLAKNKSRSNDKIVQAS